MAEKARHAFGSSQGIADALDSGMIDAYDILFLDGDTDPKVGWIDKNGNPVIIEDKKQIVRVEELPAADGDENVVYIYNNEAYIWDGTQCITLSKPADLTEVETQIANLNTQVEQKVDAATVQNMITEYNESAIEIIEF